MFSNMIFTEDESQECDKCKLRLTLPPKKNKEKHFFFNKDNAIRDVTRYQHRLQKSNKSQQLLKTHHQDSLFEISFYQILQ